MKIVVKHFADPDETITAIPGKVTVEVEADDGMAILGDDDPVELTLGQQANVEVRSIGAAGLAPLKVKVDVQAVIDRD